ncbi:hypothetical protein BS78_01G090200 [Paspalum vaginatum]|nr:hypothetical protein BS78_01G090200 [Paspalum vaginatum]
MKGKAVAPTSSIKRRCTTSAEEEAGKSIQQQQLEMPAAAADGMVTNKRRRRSHDQDDEDEERRRDKKARLLCLTRDQYNLLPRFLTEYDTAEAAARFNEDMVHTDRDLDEFRSKLRQGVVDLRPCSQSLAAEREEEDDRALGRVPDATIRMLRTLTRTRFHPTSERLLSDPFLFSQAAADKIRESDRFLSNLYAWAQAQATQAVHEYNAKGYVDYNADGTIKLTVPRPPSRT